VIIGIVLIAIGIAAVFCSALLKLGRVRPGAVVGRSAVGQLLIGIGMTLLRISELRSISGLSIVGAGCFIAGLVRERWEKPVV
jgi:hypothetical protein